MAKHHRTPALRRGRRHRRAGDEKRHGAYPGQVCLRLFEKRSGRASAGAGFALFRAKAPPHVVRLCGSHSRNRRSEGCGHPGSRLGGGYVPVVGPGWAECQQTGNGGAHPPQADRHHRRVPERAQPASEQRQGDETARVKTGGTAGKTAQARDFGIERGQGEDRVGEPDTLVRPASVSDGERPPHGNGDVQSIRRAGRRTGSIYRGRARIPKIT